MQIEAPSEATGDVFSPLHRLSRRFTQPLMLAMAMGVLGLLAYGVIAKAENPLSEGLAPEFTLTLFDGEQLSLSELRGQVVVINVWASWCPPCREEAPVLERAWRRYRDRGVTFVGLDYMDTEPAALSYLKEFDITYPNGPDLGSRISRAYNVQGVPETFFITPEGEIAEVYVGPLSEAWLTGILERLLAAKNGG